MAVILIGFQGSGKTTFGKKASEMFQKPFFDTDELLMQNHSSSSVRKLYELLGKERFRKEEEKIVFDIIHEKNSIIALGGGTIESEGVQKILKNIRVLYLYYPLHKVQERFFFKPPYLEGVEEKQFVSQRHDIYMRNCASILPCALLSQEEICIRIGYDSE